MPARSKRLKERWVKCPNCGKIHLIWSKQERGKGHIKTMNCYYCGQLVDMEELNEFGLEYEEK